MDLYIYYRVACADEHELRSRVLAMQSTLMERCRISAALKRRPDVKDERHTWMEVYEDVPEGFEEALATAIAGASLAELIDGTRHTEYFLDINACA